MFSPRAKLSTAVATPDGKIRNRCLPHRVREELWRAVTNPNPNPKPPLRGVWRRAASICPSNMVEVEQNPRHIMCFLLRSSLLWDFWSSEKSEQECQEMCSSSLFIHFGGQILLSLASEARLFGEKVVLVKRMRCKDSQGTKADIFWAPSTWLWSV